MNRTQDSISDASESPCLKPSYCLHCGSKLANTGVVESEGKRFCCAGCLSVYELLHRLGLDEYYKLKESLSGRETPVPIDAYSSESYEYLNQDNFIKIYTTQESPLTMNFYIEGIHCAACLWLIERIPRTASHIESVSLNMSTSVAEVKFRKQRTFSSFPEIVRRFGYKAHAVKIDEEAEELKDRENRRFLIRLGVAAICAGNIMLLSAAIYSGAVGAFAKLFTLLNLMLSLPVIAYSAFPFYKGVMASLRAKHATVDIPVVFVIAVGFVLSAYNFFRGSDQVYFDSISIFIFLLLASRYFLKTVQERISSKQPLSRKLLSSDRARIWDEPSQQFFSRPISELKIGDKVNLTRGERVPADGMLISTNALLNLSMLTGENIPRTVLKSDEVFAGSVVESDEAVIGVVSTGETTRIGMIFKEVEKNYQSKISFSSYSDKYATAFTSLVGITAIISFLVISSIDSPSEALNRVIAFVLIACPCAFVFALPLSLGLSLGSAFEKGFLVKDPKVFEKAQSIKNVFFDKTGTLTKGVFEILSWNVEDLSQRDQSAILAIERESSHPISRAIVTHLSDKKLALPAVEGFKHIYARGIEARVNGHVYSFISDRNLNCQNDLNQVISTRILVYKDGPLISEMLLGDSMKEDAKYLIEELKKRKLNIHILSGDREKSVRQVSEKLSVPLSNIFWEKTPEEKSEILKSTNHSMMVGDGLNDALALSSADISVAVQGSVEESLKVSDVYVLNNDLFTIVHLLEHGDAATKTMKRNRTFSVIYNLTAGALALLGFIGPLVAAILMPLSSLILVSSTLYGKGILKLDEQKRVSSKFGYSSYKTHSCEWWER